METSYLGKSPVGKENQEEGQNSFYTISLILVRHISIGNRYTLKGLVAIQNLEDLLQLAPVVASEIEQYITKFQFYLNSLVLNDSICNP
jgi:hypothetical protein